jgi:hypothetical protein
MLNINELREIKESIIKLLDAETKESIEAIYEEYYLLNAINLLENE